MTLFFKSLYLTRLITGLQRAILDVMSEGITEVKYEINPFIFYYDTYPGLG